MDTSSTQTIKILATKHSYKGQLNFRKIPKVFGWVFVIGGIPTYPRLQPAKPVPQLNR